MLLQRCLTQIHPHIGLWWMASSLFVGMLFISVLGFPSPQCKVLLGHLVLGEIVGFLLVIDLEKGICFSCEKKHSLKEVWMFACRHSPHPHRASREGLPLNGAMFTQKDLAEMWMRTLMDTYCDTQPDGDDVHLPFGTKHDVFNLYVRYSNIYWLGCTTLHTVNTYHANCSLT